MFSVHHIALSVSNIEKSKDFYDKFGFSEVLHWDDPDGNFSIKHLKNDNVFLELFAYKDNFAAPESSHNLTTDLPRIGTKHFALQVDSIEEAKNYLEIQKLADNISIKQGKTGVTYFFIKDPDGILIEILEDKRKF